MVLRMNLSRLRAGANSEEHVVPADALLVAGTCIVEEAVLTGESTPQWKNPIGTPSDDTELDVSAGCVALCSSFGTSQGDGT